MRRRFYLLPIVCLALSACAGHSHYAGLESRDIKALSADDIAGLRAGASICMALPAELNGYPGPMHVLVVIDWRSHPDSASKRRSSW